MTYTDKVQTAADMLYEAYGDKATEKVFYDIEWKEQPEGLWFWNDVHSYLCDQNRQSLINPL